MTKRKYRRHILEIIPLNFKLSTVFTTAPGHPTRLVGQRRHLKVVSPKSMAPCPNPPPPRHNGAAREGARATADMRWGLGSTKIFATAQRDAAVEITKNRRRLEG